MSDEHKPDLSHIPDIHAYLADTPFASDVVTPVSGGYANFVFRLQLRAPYNGCPTLIMKHAKPYVAGWTEMPLPVERQVFITGSMFHDYKMLIAVNCSEV